MNSCTFVGAAAAVTAVTAESWRGAGRGATGEANEVRAMAAVCALGASNRGKLVSARGAVMTLNATITELAPATPDRRTLDICASSLGSGLTHAVVHYCNPVARPVTNAANSSRLPVPVLAVARRTWLSTVRTDSVSRSAMARLDNP
jgi:hypothetical protein